MGKIIGVDGSWKIDAIVLLDDWTVGFRKSQIFEFYSGGVLLGAHCVHAIIFSISSLRTY